MNAQQKIKQHHEQINQQWDHELIPLLEKYIRIPSKSPMFDAHWQTNGYIHQAMDLLKNWCEQQPIKNKKIDLLQIDKRTPLLVIDIPGDNDDTILLYGHMDKQPEMTGWDKELGPWKPVLKDGKLSGRGGADDGYSVFAALSAITYLQTLKIPHARCVVLIEASEESGSPDLPPYLHLLKKQIGEPSFVICLDSECGNYHQLWSTTSLRGIVGGTLKIETLANGIHSGYGSGVAPSVFDILRLLLNRIANAETGEITLDVLQVTIPDERLSQAKDTALALGDELKKSVPFLSGVQPITKDNVELILNRTWRAALSIVGVDGVPAIADAGNVTLPNISVKLSMRTPPICDIQKASDTLKKILENNPPFGAKITYTSEDLSAGWHAPALANWLKTANNQASQLFFDHNAAYLGIGGTIPFMGMLSNLFPTAQFLITGVLGPNSNAHGPNEFLHIDMVKKLTGCIASVIAAHFDRAS